MVVKKVIKTIFGLRIQKILGHCGQLLCADPLTVKLAKTKSDKTETFSRFSFFSTVTACVCVWERGWNVYTERKKQTTILYNIYAALLARTFACDHSVVTNEQADSVVWKERERERESKGECERERERESNEEGKITRSFPRKPKYPHLGYGTRHRVYKYI